MANELLSTDPSPEAQAEAIALLKRAANHQDTRAMHLLAQYHEAGKGPGADPGAALGLYRHAAQLGNPHARLAIARLTAEPSKPASPTAP